MARIARVALPGYPHHLTQRGNRRQRTFFRKDDVLVAPLSPIMLLLPPALKRAAPIHDGRTDLSGRAMPCGHLKEPRTRRPGLVLCVPRPAANGSTQHSPLVTHHSFQRFHFRGKGALASCQRFSAISHETLYLVYCWHVARSPRKMPTTSVGRVPTRDCGQLVAPATARGAPAAPPIADVL
jgi:hypothetical protein